MNEESMTQEKAEKLLDEWGERLGLQDWEIHLAWQCKPEEIPFPDAGGLASFEEVTKEAQIYILDEQYDKITAMDFGYYSLIDGTTLTTSYAEISTYNSRKFSDYKVIEILAVKDNWAFLVGIIPTSAFPSRSGIACFITQDIEVDVKYKSNTSVEAKYISSSTNSVSLQIFAIK